MAQELEVDKTLSTENQYKLLIKQIKSLLGNDENIISNLSNLTAAISDSFDKVSWVGIYLFDGSRLYLGPFQGKVACTQIELGKGVCGISAKEKKTIIVPDVDKFPGHIACDSNSKSEIVVPILKRGELFGVLDIDSYQHNAFNDIDQIFLEEICNFIRDEILI